MLWVGIVTLSAVFALAVVLIVAAASLPLSSVRSVIGRRTYTRGPAMWKVAPWPDSPRRAVSEAYRAPACVERDLVCPHCGGVAGRVITQASDAAPGEGAGVSSRTGRGV